MEGPYKANHDNEGKPYVNGPGNGLSFYGGTLWPHLRFSSIDTASIAAIVANIAYSEGYKQAQADARKSFGITL